MEDRTRIPQPKSPIKSFINFKNIVSEKEHGFTLIELIVVIIIVGILAAVGISQYSATVEKSRLAEAKVRIGAMRQLVYEYYLNNGSVTAITNSDVGADGGCHPTDYYSYSLPGWGSGAQFRSLLARRCATGGKTPNTTRTYDFVMVYYPGTGQSTWYCYYSDDSSPCFGYSSGYGTVW